MSFRLPHWKWLLLPTIPLFIVAAMLPVGIPIYRQHEAIREIERLGGSVETSAGGPEWLRTWIGDERMTPFDEVCLVDLSDTQITDTGLDQLKALRGLQLLILAGTQVTNAGIERLESLTNLKSVELGGTKITDEGLDHLRPLTKLQSIGLGDCPQITDAGVSRLKDFPALGILDLSETQITDAGLELVVTQFPRLTYLDLTGTTVTDTGLASLKQSTNLDQLILNGTNVTHTGVKDLKEALPKVTVEEWRLGGESAGDARRKGFSPPKSR